MKRIEGAHAEVAYQKELNAINGKEVSVGSRTNTYDSSWTDQQILDMSKQASSQAWTQIQRTGTPPTAPAIQVVINGVPFKVNLSKDATGKITSIYSHPGKVGP